MILAKLGINITAPMRCVRMLSSKSITGAWVLPQTMVKVWTFSPSTVGLTKQLQFHRYSSDLSKHIPGEAKLTNDLKGRIPQFPLGKENVPTLLPRPGVPQPGRDMPLKRMIKILKSKTEPELIYDAEPHKLWFFASVCLGLLYIIYGLNALSIGLELAWTTFSANDLQLPQNARYLQLVSQGGLTIILAIMPAVAGYMLLMTPTRLIRRMWYLPGPVDHVKFYTHPLIPGRPTPVITIPLEQINRHGKAKIWTGRGFYGTSDKLFFFFLWEKGHRFPWIVDRKGFFWGDGRVFDVMFGKESIQEAESGLTYDDKIGLLLEERKRKKKELKEKDGIAWRFKATGRLMKDDISKIQKLLGEDAKKTEKVIGKGEEKGKTGKAIENADEADKADKPNQA
ncbi:unnamed protein product [Kuraishia capsulata CBS 1993]|uniref:Uncharacterized protein n=1 Tax=Kuraishia capsulata CBS 1993 TaxID=1382522 RepID=W6MG22_9ASCO|nr:uncharacterized protein KUCA_T00000901001 [Kuraishia capsulata CBS 1993]CDK24934.1 unnamed protein product [Kuraishia capsulata CBS 1993]